MYARKLFAGMATTAVTVAVMAVTVAPASAGASNPQPDDSAGNPTTNHLIGVGSDTSQGAVKLVGDDYNATAPTSPLFTYAACATPETCGTITLPSGDINRPNGSTAGKALLLNGGNSDIDFARSSSALDDTEKNAGLQQFPFALDTLVTATSKTSNAPATLTRADLLKIYTGAYDNWDDIPGSTTSGVIAPKIPQTGSGTRSFFLGQLRAENGGVAPTLAGSVKPTQEHDDVDIKNDPNAIGPFSRGRAEILGTLRVENGFSADRALYNVVRGTDISRPDVVAAFGTNGYFCSDAAKPRIEQAGFKQLLRPSRGGVCGQVTNEPTSNFTVAEVPTTTKVEVSSASASSARIVATVTGATSPSGTVSFFEGPTLLASNVPLVSGKATRIQPASPGAHTYRAVFVPASNSPFLASEGTGTGTVQKASSSITENFPSKVKQGKKAKGTVTVALSGSSAKASGAITIKEGSKTLVTQTLSGGSTLVTLPKLKKGKHTLVISWGGDSNGNGSTLTFKIKVQKPKKK